MQKKFTRIYTKLACLVLLVSLGFASVPVASGQFSSVPPEIEYEIEVIENTDYLRLQSPGLHCYVFMDGQYENSFNRCIDSIPIPDSSLDANSFKIITIVASNDASLTNVVQLNWSKTESVVSVDEVPNDNFYLQYYSNTQDFSYAEDVQGPTLSWKATPDRNFSTFHLFSASIGGDIVDVYETPWTGNNTISYQLESKGSIWDDEDYWYVVIIEDEDGNVGVDAFLTSIDENDDSVDVDVGGSGVSVNPSLNIEGLIPLIFVLGIIAFILLQIYLKLPGNNNRNKPRRPGY